MNKTEPCHFLEFLMEDGSCWKCPALPIAQDRARYYAKRDHERDPKAETLKVFEAEVEFARQDLFLLEDWARNNMTWEQLGAWRTRAPTPPDYNVMWRRARVRGT